MRILLKKYLWFSTIATCALLFNSTTYAQNAQYFNFEGQLLDANDIPLNSPVSSVVFQIIGNNGSSDCILFHQEHSSVAIDTIGLFSAKIGPHGNGTRNPSIDGGISWSLIFQNTNFVRTNDSTYCPGGYDPTTHSQLRKLRVIVNGTPLTPDFSMGSVPSATVAETLQGKGPNDFISNSGGHITGGNELRFSPSTNTANYVSLKAPATLSGGVSFILPNNLGTNGYVLMTDGSGQLSWTSAGAGTVTSITAGAGLTGSTITNSGTIALATDGVTSTHILDETISTNDLANNSITTVKLANGAVTSNQILDGTISAADMATAAITTTKIADSAITNTKIADVGINKITSAASQYFNYHPNGTACSSGDVLKWNVVLSGWDCATDNGGIVDHGLLNGLSNDHHPQYNLLAGRAGGQIINGGTGAYESLRLESTSHAQKGSILLVAERVGVGTLSPLRPLHVEGSVRLNPVAVPASPGAGDIYMESGSNKLKYHNGTQWVDLTPAKTLYKSSNQTVTTDVTTNDTTFYFNSVPNTKYLIDAVFYITPGAAGSIIFNWSGDISTLSYLTMNNASNPSGAASNMPYGGPATLSLQATGTQAIHMKGILASGATSGPLTLQWANTSGNNISFTMISGSYMRIEQLNP